MRLVYRPIEVWPGKPTSPRREAPFESTWQPTLVLLDKELRHLDVEEAVLQVDSPSERDFRLDGGLRADAKLRSPAVILSFEIPHVGPVSYPCDTFDKRGYRSRLEGWQTNVRAIALGLEALRKLDRYGITSENQQYTGWKQIGTGSSPVELMTYSEASDFLRQASELDTPRPWTANSIETAYRIAAKRMARLHPDQGGDGEHFTRLNVARDILRKGTT